MKTKQSYLASTHRGSWAVPWCCHRVVLTAWVLFGVGMFTTAQLAAEPSGVGGKRDLAVLSQNVYVGGLIERVAGCHRGHQQRSFPRLVRRNELLAAKIHPFPRRSDAWHIPAAGLSGRASRHRMEDCLDAICHRC
jgi:hypothetical protein